jgi:predicted DNA-binding transcriptional regulator AlpA
VSATRLELTDAQLERLADLLAPRIAELVSAEIRDAMSEGATPSSGRLLTAAQVAQFVGIGRDAVYRRAEEFGAVRIGAGSKARLRFDAEKLTAALEACSTGRESVGAQRPRRQGSGRRSGSKPGSAFPLLPVRGVE